MAEKDAPGRTVADNRRARHEYAIQDVFEAGIVLVGSEVKSLRAGRANIGESYAHPEGDAIYLLNASIPVYAQAGRFNHEERRPRKLLLHRRQIAKLMGAVRRDGMTLVPLRLFFNDRGFAKIDIALAKGKKLHDKREADKARDWGRQKARLLRDRG